MEAADEICKRLDEEKKRIGRKHNFNYWSKRLENKKGKYVENYLVIEIPQVGKFNLEWLKPVLSIEPREKVDCTDRMAQSCNQVQ